MTAGRSGATGERLKIGIIGGGAIAQVAHLPVLKKLRNIEVQAICDTDLPKARALAERFHAVVVLKGSGSIIAAPAAVPFINLSGNARLASAGTGDVLAGMVGAALAAGQDALSAARGAVWRHGALADAWPQNRPLTAGALAEH